VETFWKLKPEKMALDTGVLGIIPLWAAVAIGDVGGLLAVSLNLLLMAREIWI